MKKTLAIILTICLSAAPLTVLAAEEETVVEETTQEEVSEAPQEKVQETPPIENVEETHIIEEPQVTEEPQAIEEPQVVEEPQATEESQNVQQETEKETVEEKETFIEIVEEFVEEIIEEPIDLTSSFPEEKAPSIEDKSWDNYAISYDYNYDTSSAAQWGAWGGNAGLSGQTYEDTNNNDVSNKIGLYTNGDTVKVYVGYAGLFNGAGNGNDYNISIDGQNAKYRVVLEDGTDLSGAYLAPGTYKLKVINGDGSVSGQEVVGATGYIIVKERNAYNEMEFEIPVSAIKEQNSNVNEHFSKVDFYSPNIMSRGPVSCGGAPTDAGFIGIFMALIGLI